ncbi:MAG: hypothetical protein IIY21_17835 [Clostridiales bacterium]|nr:hypothetical protein [Clostridiales bacterium]
MTQKELIIQYMNDFGSITTIEAFSDLGITKLTTRISELRRDGYVIASKRIDKKNRYGKKVKFNRYWLEAV